MLGIQLSHTPIGAYISSYTRYIYHPADCFAGISAGVLLPFGDKEIEPIRNLIQNADTALRVSPDIDQIIEEEAAFYFNGTKPVEEVVDIIANRVRTYVNEVK